jgi:hypothetical protein
VQIINHFIAAHDDCFDPALTVRAVKHRYREKMLVQQGCATTVEMIACSLAFNVRVMVHNVRGGLLLDTNRRATRTFHLIYDTEAQHYDAAVVLQ